MKKLLLLSFLCVHGMSLAMQIDDEKRRQEEYSKPVMPLMLKQRLEYPASKSGGWFDHGLSVHKLPAEFEEKDIICVTMILAKKVRCASLVNNYFFQATEATAVINVKNNSEIRCENQLPAIDENNLEFRKLCQSDEKGLFSQFEILFGENNSIACDAGVKNTNVFSFL